MEFLKVENWAEALKHPEISSPYALVAKLINKQSVIADLGCGAGYGTAFLAQHPGVLRAIGVDNSPEALSIAARCFKTEKTAFYQKNLELDKRIFNTTFDYVLCFNVLPLLVEDHIFLKQAFLVTKRGGYFILSLPLSSTNVQADSTVRLKYRHYTFVEITNALSKAGFAIVDYFEQFWQEENCVLARRVSETSNIFVCERKYD